MELVDIPTDSPIFTGIHVVYLYKGDNIGGCGALGYLQAIRSRLRDASDDPENSSLAISYRAQLRFYIKDLNSLLVESFDAVLSPPSRFTHAAPYRKAFLVGSPDTIDLTDSFPPTKTVLSGEDNPLDNIIEDLVFVPSGKESTINSLLIIDDIFRRGRTTAAVLTHLQRSGLPETCRVSVACPLWLHEKME